MTKEPVGIGAAIVVLVNSVLSLGVLLDVWHLDADELAGFNAVLVNLVAVAAALFARSKVTPTGA